jgi:hypothetical protein
VGLGEGLRLFLSFSSLLGGLDLRENKTPETVNFCQVWAGSGAQYKSLGFVPSTEKKKTKTMKKKFWVPF